jgi:hypothetical protein
VAELIVALTISAVVAALAAGALVGVERQTRASTGASDAGRLEQDVEAILRSEIRGSWGDSLALRGDTAIELFVHVGSSVVCGVSGRVLTLPPSLVATEPPLSRWRYTPAAGDLIFLYDTTTRGWARVVLDSAVSRVDAAGCLPSTGLLARADSIARRPVMRVVLPAAPTAGVVTGVPARLVRRGRWGLVKGGDKSWELAWRPCDAPGHCGASQPAVGPLAAPADTGLRFRLDNGGWVEVSLRAGNVSGRPVAKIAVPVLARSVP